MDKATSKATTSTTNTAAKSKAQADTSYRDQDKASITELLGITFTTYVTYCCSRLSF